MSTEKLTLRRVLKTVIMTVLVILLAIPAFAVIFVYASLKFLITAPFEHLNYTHSDYFKKYGVKYHYHITHSLECEVYEHTKNNPNVSYNRNDDGYVYLKSKNVLYLLPTISDAAKVDGELTVARAVGHEKVMEPWDERLADELSHVHEDIESLDVRVLIRDELTDDARSVLESRSDVTLYESYDYLETLGSPDGTAA